MKMQTHCRQYLSNDNYDVNKELTVRPSYMNCYNATSVEKHRKISIQNANIIDIGKEEYII